MEALLAALAIGLATVLVHEFGHWVAARLLDVAIARVRIGLGPPLLRLRFRGVRVHVCALPVVLLADLAGRDPHDPVPEGEAGRSLRNRPLWVRAAVLLAGPAANLAFPLVLWFGYQIRQTEVPPPVVGTVVDGSAAETAGLVPGDRVVSIDGDDVRSFDELARRIAGAAQQELRVHLVHDGEHRERFVIPRRAVELTGTGEPRMVGRLGVLPWFYAPQIGVTDPDGPAARAGLRTGDVLTSIDGEPLETVEDLERWLPRLARRSQVRLTFLRPTAGPGPLATWVTFDSHHAQLLAPSSAFGDPGMAPANTFVRRVLPGSPAAAAGIEPGDRIVAVDGKRFRRWEFLEAELAAARQRPVVLTVERPGAPPRTVTVRQRFVTETDPKGLARRTLLFGAIPYRKTFEPPPEPLRGRFAYAVSSSLATWRALVADVAEAVLRLPARLLSATPAGSVVATVTAAGRRGALPDAEVLRLASIVTIVAGLLHLLPLPILDGGRLLFDLADALRRRPSTARARLWAGLALVLAVFVLLALLWTRPSP